MLASSEERAQWGSWGHRASHTPSLEGAASCPGVGHAAPALVRVSPSHRRPAVLGGLIAVSLGSDQGPRALTLLSGKPAEPDPLPTSPARWTLLWTPSSSRGRPAQRPEHLPSLSQVQAAGHELFQQVCDLAGIREAHFFGLSVIRSKQASPDDPGPPGPLPGQGGRVLGAESEGDPRPPPGAAWCPRVPRAPGCLGDSPSCTGAQARALMLTRADIYIVAHSHTCTLRHTHTCSSIHAHTKYTNTHNHTRAHCLTYLHT